MTISDYMLEMACGDASTHDIHIQESVGKINVSSAIFDTAYKISELPEGEFQCVQEAADAGLPTKPEEAAGLANESVKQALIAFYDTTIGCVKKVKEAADKDMKLIVGIAKAKGITFNEQNLVTGFVDPLVKALGDGKKSKSIIQLSDKKFLKANSSLGLVEDFGDSFACMSAIYGINISNVFGDSIIQTIFGNSYKPVKENIETLIDVSRNMKCGGSKSPFSGSPSVTNSISTGDLSDFIISVYALIKLTGTILAADKANGGKKVAIQKISAICDADPGKKEKKVGRHSAKIGENISKWTDNIVSGCDDIVKSFGDSVYALVEAVGK